MKNFWFERNILLCYLWLCASLYFIGRGVCLWNNTDRFMLVKAIATGDEYEEYVPSFNFFGLIIKSDQLTVPAKFKIPDLYGDKTFDTKIPVSCPGKACSRKLFHQGDVLTVWVNTNNPEADCDYVINETAPLGTVKIKSGKDNLILGLILFIVACLFFRYHWKIFKARHVE